MKIKPILTTEERQSLENFITIDICKDIDCSSFSSCDGCPLHEATNRKEDLDKMIRKIIAEQS